MLHMFPFTRFLFNYRDDTKMSDYNTLALHGNSFFTSHTIN